MFFIVWILSLTRKNISYLMYQRNDGLCFWYIMKFVQEKWYKNCACLRKWIQAQKNTKNLKPSKKINIRYAQKVEVSNWGKDRNLSESGSRWTWRSHRSDRALAVDPHTDWLRDGCTSASTTAGGPAREPRAGLPPAAPAPAASCPTPPLSRLHLVFLFGSEASRIHSWFFLRSLNILIFRNITLVVKEPTFSLEYKENFGDLSSNREASIKYSLDLPFIRLLNPQNKYTFRIWNNLVFHYIINS